MATTSSSATIYNCTYTLEYTINAFRIDANNVRFDWSFTESCSTYNAWNTDPHYGYFSCGGGQVWGEDVMKSSGNNGSLPFTRSGSFTHNVGSGAGSYWFGFDWRHAGVSFPSASGTVYWEEWIPPTAPPTGLTVSAPKNITTTGATFDVSITSYGTPATEAGRYIEAAILNTSTYGSQYRYRISPKGATSATITVDNTANTGDPALTIRPNARYYYGAYATNTQVSTSTVAGQFTTLAEAGDFVINEVSTDFINITYTDKKGGEYHARYIEYKLNDETTWEPLCDFSGWNPPLFITKNITGLEPNTEYTMMVRVRTTAGNTPVGTYTFTTLPVFHLYGSINGQTKEIKKLYGSINGQTKKITKLYASVDGKTKQVFKSS